jgi:hypothetical protein
VALPDEVLRDSQLEIKVRAKKQDGSTQDLPLIKVPRQLANAFNNFQVGFLLIFMIYLSSLLLFQRLMVHFTNTSMNSLGLLT